MIIILNNMDFKKELKPIADMLNSPDMETRMLGYSLLRESQFKKFMYGKLWSLDNKSFYRFNLYALEPDVYSFGSKEYYYTYIHNENKLSFAYRVVFYYLENKLIIKKPLWQE